MNALCPCCATGMRVTQTKTEGYALTCPACSCQAFARSPKSANALTARLEATHDQETNASKGNPGKGKAGSGTGGAEAKARPAAKSASAPGGDGKPAGGDGKPKRKGFLEELWNG